MSPPLRPLGWAVVGASAIARDYMVNAIRVDQGSRLVAVMSSSAERAAKFAKRFAIPAWHASIEALFADEAVEAVYVSTHNERHHEVTLAAAEAGRHVLCEKPLALSLAEARAMIAACAKAGVELGVNHHFRCTVLHRRLRAMVEAGAVGRPLAVRLLHPVTLPMELRTWRLTDACAGGVVLDLTVHDADLVRFLLADELREVVAVSARQGMASADVDDSVVVGARTDAGTVVSLHDTFVVSHAPSRIEVHGTVGSLVGKNGMDEARQGALWLLRDERPEPVELEPYTNPYVSVVQRFREAVRGSGTPVATGEDGLRSLAFALAAASAAASGRRVVLDAAE